MPHKIEVVAYEFHELPKPVIKRMYLKALVNGMDEKAADTFFGEFYYTREGLRLGSRVAFATSKKG